jgi:hypothetical protein
MQDDAILPIPTLKRAPWNKGKLIGAKPPLRQKQVGRCGRNKQQKMRATPRPRAC